TMLNAKELLEAGKLNEAIQAMNEEVKRNPTDLQRRGFLAELLCASGRLERADAQLEVIVQQDAKAALTVALMRQLIRAETARRPRSAGARRRVFGGAGPPGRHLAAGGRPMAGESPPADAARLLEQAEEQRPRVKGTCNGKPFSDLRDLDDVTAGVFEVLTST